MAGSFEVKVDFDLSKVKVMVGRERAMKALDRAANNILEEANRMVPLDTGNLMRSGDTSLGDTDLTATIFYDTPYATRLHEHPEYNFQGGREGKWLERALNENHDRILAWMKSELEF